MAQHHHHHRNSEDITEEPLDRLGEYRKLASPDVEAWVSRNGFRSLLNLTCQDVRDRAACSHFVKGVQCDKNNMVEFCGQRIMVKLSDVQATFGLRAHGADISRPAQQRGVVTYQTPPHLNRLKFLSLFLGLRLTNHGTCKAIMHGYHLMSQGRDVNWAGFLLQRLFVKMKTTKTRHENGTSKNGATYFPYVQALLNHFNLRFTHVPRGIPRERERSRVRREHSWEDRRRTRSRSPSVREAEYHRGREREYSRWRRSRSPSVRDREYNRSGREKEYRRSRSVEYGRRSRRSRSMSPTVEGNRWRSPGYSRRSPSRSNNRKEEDKDKVSACSGSREKHVERDGKRAAEGSPELAGRPKHIMKCQRDGGIGDRETKLDFEKVLPHVLGLHQVVENARGNHGRWSPMK